jgi:hypothetical protein
MFVYYFFLIFFWIMVIVSLKLLKDFALTSIFGLLITTLGVYGIGNMSVGEPLIYAFSLAQIFIGLYFVFRSSVDLINKGGKSPSWEGFKEWLKQKKQKKNCQKKSLK